MFQQFLDATYKLMVQYPTRFEYNERFLRRLLFHVYSCQYGNFLHNNDLERRDGKVREKTQSVWNYFMSRRKMWLNEAYDKSADSAGRERELDGGRVLFPRTGPAAVKWWAPLWGREDAEMNGASPPPPAPRSPTPPQPTTDDDDGDRHDDDADLPTPAPLPPPVSAFPTVSALPPAAANVANATVSQVVEGVRGLAMGLPIGNLPKKERRRGGGEEEGTEMT